MSPATPPHEGEKAATAARASLGLTPEAPIDDILGLIEAEGIPVFIATFSRVVAGMARKAAGRWFVFANAGHVPRRQRFTLAHEFAHARLEHEPRLDRVEHLQLTEPRSDADRNEVTANYFAGEFLLPRAAIFAALSAPDCPQDPLDFSVALGARYGLSEHATAVRLRTCDVITRLEFESVRAKLETKQHQLRRAALGVTELADTVQQVYGANAYPRFPAAHRERLRRALEAQLLPADDALLAPLTEH